MAIPQLAQLPEIKSLNDLKDYPIGFGRHGEHTYQFELVPYRADTYLRTLQERRGQDWGKYHIAPAGNFRLWGVLEGAQFDYSEGIAASQLHLTKDDVEITIGATHKGATSADFALINGVSAPLQNPNFYKSPTPTKPVEDLTLQDALYLIFSNYRTWLNVETVREVAKHIEEKVTPRQLRRTLDTFL